MEWANNLMGPSNSWVPQLNISPYHISLPSALAAERRDEDEAHHYFIKEFAFSNRNTDSEHAVLCSDTRVLIRLFADHLSEAPKLKGRYLFFLQVAGCRGRRASRLDERRFVRLVMQAFLLLLHDVPSRRRGIILEYTLHVAGGELSPTPYSTHQSNLDEAKFGFTLSSG